VSARSEIRAKRTRERIPVRRLAVARYPINILLLPNYQRQHKRVKSILPFAEVR
jgi:hypothetical protein